MHIKRIIMDKKTEKQETQEKQEKKDQLENELITAEKEYDQLFDIINKRRAAYLEKDLVKKNKY